jgi:sigma-B regulation protein RsbU (phosphoserine phosphatase)
MKPIDFHDFHSTLLRTRDALDSERQGIEARTRLAAIEQEIEIAARIQASILPRDFFPGRADFGLYAEMKPARRVGGDFYDFFLIDEHRLGFLIGDVSGKGIPAALYMAVSRTLLQAAALQGLTPAECLEYANRILGRHGEPGVYVTIFYGILHTDTGELEFGLGGHNPPYRVSPEGELSAITEPGGAVVGLLKDATYETGHLRLAPGESVFLFTDGVTEALDAEEHFFGDRRLREVLARSANLSPQESVRAVLEAVAGFTGDAPQSDDITAMCVRWTG